jgi:hypothetical protein
MMWATLHPKIEFAGFLYTVLLVFSLAIVFLVDAQNHVVIATLTTQLVWTFFLLRVYKRSLSISTGIVIVSFVICFVIGYVLLLVYATPRIEFVGCPSPPTLKYVDGARACLGLNSNGEIVVASPLTRTRPHQQNEWVAVLFGVVFINIACFDLVVVVSLAFIQLLLKRQARVEEAKNLTS